MRVFFYFLVGVGAALTFYLAAPAASATSITCANVRCAGGSCVDTPTGPVCQPQTLTCANMLCPQGKVCRETSSGPACQPIKYPPIEPPTQSGHVGADGCKLVKQYSYGQAYYRRVCPPRPVAQPGYNNHHYYPPRPRRPRYYGHGYNHHYPRHGYPRHHYTPPTPAPQPTPTNPGNEMACTQQYAPVCAQKQVQCFRAPCPPVQQTFSNSCMAGNAGYSVIRLGTCEERRWPE